MAAFNFPNSPSTNDVHTENGVSWKWNGTVWKKVASPDTIAKANSKVQVVDAGTGGYVTAETDGTQRLRIQNSGAIVTGILTATSFNVGTAGTISSAGNITLDKPGAGIVTATKYYGDGSALTGITDNVVTINNNANNRLITGSGTANTLEGEATLTYDGTFLTATSNNFVLKGIDTNASNAESFIQLNAGKIFYHSDENNAASGSGHYFHVDGSEKVRIDAGGKLILGTTTAGQTGEADALTVYQAGHTGITIRTGGTSNNTAIYFADGTSGDQNYRGSITYTHSGDNLVFKTAAAERLRITSSGDVGIGYNSPTVKLHLREAASGFSGTYDNRYHITMENNGEAYLGFYVPDNQYAGIRFHDTTGCEAGIDYYYPTDSLQFYATDHQLFKTAGTERLRIDSSGDISIGNGAGYAVWNNTGNDQRPRFQLKQTGGDDRGVVFLEERGDANGMDVFISKSRGGSGAGAITSGDTLGFLKFSGADGTRQHNAAGIQCWNNGTVATGRVAGNMSLYTAPDSAASMLERIRITSTGLVKISGDGQNDGFYLSNAYGQAGIFGGMYYNGSSWVRAASGSRLGAGMYVNTGGHIAFLKAPETSGTSATVTESARITSDGNLLINGTTYYGTGTGSLQVHDAQFVLSKPSGSNTRNWRFINNNTVAGNLGIQVSTASGGTTYATVMDFTKEGRAHFGPNVQDIQIIPHSTASGHGQIYLRGNASNETSSIKLNHYGHADYVIGVGRYTATSTNGLFSITRTDGGTDGLIMNTSGKLAIGKAPESLTGHGFNAKLQVNTGASDDYNGIMIGGGYTRSTIQNGATYDLILTSNAYPANATSKGIRFKCGTNGGGGPNERFRIHSDGMLETRQHGSAKTYWFSSGAVGGYSTCTIVINAHAWHSFMISVSHGGYGGVWGTAKYLGYENGSLYNANEGTETTDSNSRNITHSHDGGHKHKIVISGGVGTHPGCELRVTICGDGYIDTGDITWTWS